MQGPIRCVLVAGLLLGCSGDDTNVPTPDGPVGGGGLVVTWSSNPESWPASLDGNVSLERATFAFDSLRVVGDAGPGDPRTTAAGFQVRWDSDTTPDDIMFADAPTGLYSQVSMAIDGHLTTDSFEIRGTATANSETREFRIEGDSPLAITLEIDKTLTPPDAATVKLRVNFANALDSVDFATADIEDGRFSIEDGDAQMATFRQKLTESFEVLSGTGPGFTDR